MAGILAFVFSRAGQYLLAFAAGMALLVAAYQTGVSAERNRGVAASLRNEIAILKLDIAIAKSSEEAARKEAADLDAASKGNSDALEALKRKIAQRAPADRCGLSADDLNFLRSIR